MIPFGSQYTAPEAIARSVSETVPVILIQNDCLLTSGATILEAFDRLEVAENSARSLIDSQSLGDVVPIGAKDLADIRGKFF